MKIFSDNSTNKNYQNLNNYNYKKIALDASIILGSSMLGLGAGSLSYHKHYKPRALKYAKAERVKFSSLLAEKARKDNYKTLYGREILKSQWEEAISAVRSIKTSLIKDAKKIHSVSLALGFALGAGLVLLKNAMNKNNWIIKKNEYFDHTYL